MGYFHVRYDSRVEYYDRRGFIRLATGLHRVPTYLPMKCAIPRRYVNQISEQINLKSVTTDLAIN